MRTYIKGFVRIFDRLDREWFGIDLVDERRI
jgi:hypothetical protein